MFDIAFSELLVIGLIALVVIGPERLPKVARTAGQWLGRLNRYVSQVKQDIDRDIKLEELRKMQQDMKDAAQKYEILANDTARQVETAVEQETGQISRVMQAMSATDGGLAVQEYEKIKAGEAAKAGSDAAASVKGEAAPAPAESEPAEVAANPHEPPATPAEAGARPAPPPPKAARAPEDYPDGPVG